MTFDDTYNAICARCQDRFTAPDLPNDGWIYVTRCPRCPAPVRESVIERQINAGKALTKEALRKRRLQTLLRLEAARAVK